MRTAIASWCLLGLGLLAGGGLRPMQAAMPARQLLPRHEVAGYWRSVTIRPDLAAIWIERSVIGAGVDEEDCSVPFIVFLRGRDGWLSEDAAVDSPYARRRPPVYRSGEVEVPLGFRPELPAARLWDADVPLRHGNVMLVTGLGEPAQPRLRTLGSFRARCGGEMSPPERLYDRLVHLRAKIHYTQ